jgi:hypothetical protein
MREIVSANIWGMCDAFKTGLHKNSWGCEIFGKMVFSHQSIATARADIHIVFRGVPRVAADDVPGCSAGIVEMRRTLISEHIWVYASRAKNENMQRTPRCMYL